MNIGVVVFGDGVIRSRFLSDWRRASTFGGGKSVAFLREFATRVKHWAPIQEEFPGLEMTVHVSGEQLRDFARDWKNSIQFSDPKASLLGADALLADVVSRFLKPPQRKKRVRDRRAATNLAYRSLLSALTTAGVSEPEHYLHRSFLIEGAIELHRFELGVRNGKLIGASRTISFESEGPTSLDREIEAVAYSLSDVRQKIANVSLSVIAIPPRSPGSKAFARAEKVFSSFGATLIPEAYVDTWAEQEAQAVLAS